MIPKHIRPFDQALGKFRTGPMNRAAARRLAAYIMRLSSGGFEVCNDFGPGDPSGICDVMEELLSRGDTACWGRHMLLSWSAEDKGYDGHEGELVDAFKKKTGAKWVLAWRHNDKAHGHLHMFVLEIDERFRSLKYRDGKKNIAQLLRELAVELEDQYGGTKTGRDPEHSVNLTKNELEQAAREHREGKRATPAPDKLVLQLKLDRLVRTAGSIDELATLCIAEGLEMRISDFVNKDGRPGKGLSFCVAGSRPFRGGELGWSWPKLQRFYERTESGRPQEGRRIIGLGRETHQLHCGEDRAEPAFRRDHPDRTPVAGGQNGVKPVGSKHRPFERRQSGGPNPIINLFVSTDLSWFMRAFLALCKAVNRSERQRWYDEVLKDRRSIEIPKL